jgi:inosose dehydratase
MIVGTNSYRWLQYFQARGERLEDHLDEALAATARAGLDAWEQAMLPDDAIATRLGRLLDEHGLSMPSMYVGCRLHDDAWRASSDVAMQHVARGVALGARFICVNPDPIAWHAPADKDDDALARQAERLALLGERVRDAGARLIYHFHAPEFRQAAREVHHMLLTVPADLLGLCFDVHWAYRGCGNSNLAAQDLLRLYGDRVATLHVRQSHGGVWAETLGEGDVAYAPIVAALRQQRFDGPVHIELASESGTPQTMSLEDAHRLSLAWVRDTFAG